MGPWKTKLEAVAVLCGDVMGCGCDDNVTVSGSCIYHCVCIHIYNCGTMMVIVLVHIVHTKCALHLQSTCTNCVIITL